MVLLEQFEHLTLHPKNAARLKELVLQLAVQGKLTQTWRNQNPHVEPASELLKRIEAEKAQLVKEKKMKKEKPLEPISEEEILDELPETWTWCRLGEAISFTNGYAFQSSSFTDEGIGIIRIGDLQNGEVVTQSMKYVDSDEFESLLQDFAAEPGAMLIAMSGATTGKIAVNNTSTTFLLNQRVGKIRPILVNSLFLNSLLNTKIEENLRISKGSAIPNLSTAQIKEIIFPLPPLAEQEAIVARVEELMQKIEELEKANQDRIQLQKSLGAAALQALTTAPDHELEQQWAFLQQHFQILFGQEANVKKLRETILQLAVQGKLTSAWRRQNPTTQPAAHLLQQIQAEKAQLVKDKKIKKEKPLEPISEDEVPYELPDSWVWCRLGEICLKVTDGTHHSPPNIEAGKYKYVTAKNIKNDGVLLSNITYVTEEIHQEIYSRCNPEKGDILYIKDGATTGIVTINNLDEPFSMLSSVALLKLPKEVDNKFLLYLMRSPYFYEATRSGMSGVAITRVTLSKINYSLSPLPPLAEQEAIVAKVDQLMQLCDALEQQLAQANQQAEALMQAVVQEALQPQEEGVLEE
ncbi:restriction endonuclease subunit S [Rufibacter sp. XAAS-G3-1]|uniref:restriction endonuclease subunit S n=1 Tax=Rufibacter sp. XAAS-G3-1 TaxID=2729134 RepID=UPI0015E73F56|nr:restriction endonuclease subunit S [Rufibacter sp. XAAS-G3-1]